MLQGRLSLVIQSSTALPELPASAIDIKGGTVASTSPVQGSNGRLFNVVIDTAAGAGLVAVSTLGGVGLANGLSTARSNTVSIQLSNDPPKVRFSTPDTCLTRTDAVPVTAAHEVLWILEATL